MNFFLIGEIFDVTFNHKELNKKGNVFKAFEFFQKCLNEYTKKLPQIEQAKKIFEVYTKIRDIQLVRIVVENRDAANVLFAALNDRGKKLTALDLIKNQILAKLSDEIEKLENATNKKEILKKYFGYWNRNIAGKITKDNNTEQERFLRQIYNAYRKMWLEQYPELKLEVAERANLLTMYETIINGENVSIRDFIDDLKQAAIFYSHVQYQDELLAETKVSFADLRHVDGTTSGTLLIYLLKNKGALQLTDKNFENICALLCNLFIRRLFTGKPRSNDLDDIFINFIAEIEKNSYTGKEIEENLRETLKAASADDESFAKALRENVYKGGASDDKTRFILEKIANAHLGANDKIDVWNKKQKWTIEHILPQTINAKKQTEKLDDDWIKMLGGEEAKALEIQREYVHKLGNLTLTKYNSALSNKTFTAKKEATDKKTNAPIGLKILSDTDGLNSYVFAQKVWTPKQIEERTENLIEEIIKIFAWKKNLSNQKAAHF
ncbi:MAG: DUF1524 domain-containing protein [Selenomonadaceae bacterium]|nr:DUF1524 domain-containing protein [Selenomonadaceae bacterium]